MSTAASTMQATPQIIRAMEAEFAGHANVGDAAGLSEAFYAAEAQLQPPNAPPAKGLGAIREFWTAFLAANPTGIQMATLAGR